MFSASLRLNLPAVFCPASLDKHPSAVEAIATVVAGGFGSRKSFHMFLRLSMHKDRAHLQIPFQPQQTGKGDESSDGYTAQQRLESAADQKNQLLLDWIREVEQLALKVNSIIASTSQPNNDNNNTKHCGCFCNYSQRLRFSGKVVKLLDQVEKLQMEGRSANLLQNTCGGQDRCPR